MGDVYLRAMLLAICFIIYEITYAPLEYRRIIDDSLWWLWCKGGRVSISSATTLKLPLKCSYHRMYHAFSRMARRAPARATSCLNARHTDTICHARTITSRCRSFILIILRLSLVKWRRCRTSPTTPIRYRHGVLLPFHMLCDHITSFVSQEDIFRRALYHAYRYIYAYGPPAAIWLILLLILIIPFREMRWCRATLTAWYDTPRVPYTASCCRYFGTNFGHPQNGITRLSLCLPRYDDTMSPRHYYGYQPLWRYYHFLAKMGTCRGRFSSRTVLIRYTLLRWYIWYYVDILIILHFRELRWCYDCRDVSTMLHMLPRAFTVISRLANWKYNHFRNEMMHINAYLPFPLRFHIGCTYNYYAGDWLIPHSQPEHDAARRRFHGHDATMAAGRGWYTQLVEVILRVSRYDSCQMAMIYHY